MSALLNITSDVLAEGSYRALHAGDTYDMRFSARRNGVAISLVGAKVYLTIKDDEIKTDANARLQLSSSDPAEIEITDAVAGEFVVHFASTGPKSTASLSGLELPYDIQLILASGSIITLARGVIEFLPQITRATS